MGAVCRVAAARGMGAPVDRGAPSVDFARCDAHADGAPDGAKLLILSAVARDATTIGATPAVGRRRERPGL